jgi:hypothetical protein
MSEFFQGIRHRARQDEGPPARAHGIGHHATPRPLTNRYARTAVVDFICSGTKRF